MPVACEVSICQLRTDDLSRMGRGCLQGVQRQLCLGVTGAVSCTDTVSASVLVFLRAAGSPRPVPVQTSLTNSTCYPTAGPVFMWFHFVEENRR